MHDKDNLNVLLFDEFSFILNVLLFDEFSFTLLSAPSKSQIVQKLTLLRDEIELKFRDPRVGVVKGPVSHLQIGGDR
jgi:hypothetical protein